MGELTAAQLSAFHRDGFLAVEQLLTDIELAPFYDEYDSVLDAQVDRLVASGRLDQPPLGDFSARYSALLAADPDAHRWFNISLPLVNGPVDADTYVMHCGPAVFDLMRNPKILDLVESVIGPEIVSNPVQQMRMKPPVSAVEDDSLRVHSNIGATTWHQDIVALLPDADHTQIVTVWVALTDAFVENGCLVSIPGSHRLGSQVHCANGELASEPNVPPAVLDGMESQSLAVPRGGVVLFDKLNVHCSLPNTSASMRWSMDLRYNRVGEGTGRPAFPSFVARSASTPHTVLDDYDRWRADWDEARESIVRGRGPDRIFEDVRWNDPAVC